MAELVDLFDLPYETSTPFRDKSDLLPALDLPPFQSEDEPVSSGLAWIVPVVIAAIVLPMLLVGGGVFYLVTQAKAQRQAEIEQIIEQMAQRSPEDIEMDFRWMEPLLESKTESPVLAEPKTGFEMSDEEIAKQNAVLDATIDQLTEMQKKRDAEERKLVKPSKTFQERLQESIAKEIATDPESAASMNRFVEKHLEPSEPPMPHPYKHLIPSEVASDVFGKSPAEIRQEMEKRHEEVLAETRIQDARAQAELNRAGPSYRRHFPKGYSPSLPTTPMQRYRNKRMSAKEIADSEFSNKPSNKPLGHTETLNNQTAQQEVVDPKIAAEKIAADQEEALETLARLRAKYGQGETNDP